MSTIDIADPVRIHTEEPPVIRVAFFHYDGSTFVVIGDGETPEVMEWPDDPTN